MTGCSDIFIFPRIPHRQTCHIAEQYACLPLGSFVICLLVSRSHRTLVRLLRDSHSQIKNELKCGIRVGYGQVYLTMTGFRRQGLD